MLVVIKYAGAVDRVTVTKSKVITRDYLPACK